MIRSIVGALLLLLALQTTAQKTVSKLPGEYWWGGQTARYSDMPFEEGFEADLTEDFGAQVQTLLISNKGRYIWNETPFSFKVDQYDIVLSEGEGFVIGQKGKTLASAQKYVAKNFLPQGNRPPHRGISQKPQYDLEVELGMGLNQDAVIRFAERLIEEEFPAGILRFGDSWHSYPGDFTFDGGKFPDALKMIRKLHEMGFQVIVDVSPFISPDSEVFRTLHKENDAFLKDALDPEAVKLVKWEKGYSALLDLSNAEVQVWFKDMLKRTKKNYGVDGFNFLAGNLDHFTDVVAAESIAPSELAIEYARIGLSQKISYLGPGSQMGGYPLVRSLPSEELSWNSLSTMVDAVALQGIMGYPHSHMSFYFDNSNPRDTIDQDLIVRTAQLQAFMPSMSSLPIPMSLLDQEHKAAYKKALSIREELGAEISKLASKAASTGVPLIQSMEYAFPDKGYIDIRDQFMLGKDYFVAPVVEPNQTKKEVTLPKGNWLASNGKVYIGPTKETFKVTLDDVLYFKRVFFKEQ